MVVLETLFLSFGMAGVFGTTYLARSQGLREKAGRAGVKF